MPAMRTSVEISLYPLRKDYGTSILQFIDRLKKHPQLQVHVNTMSTHVFGEYDDVMRALAQEMKITFEEEGEKVFTIKIVNFDLRP